MRSNSFLLGSLFLLSLLGSFFLAEPIWAAESQIAAGGYHTVALKSDGTLWAWGRNDYGQLGDGTNINRTAPVQVSGGGTTWVAIKAGVSHTVALKSDGTLWAWGRNDYGQLGDGTNTNRTAPVQVFGGGTTWVAIAAGYYHTVALKSDGTLWAWGYNSSGQLGDGTTINRTEPGQVSGGGTTWVAIAAGGYHTVALKSNGTLWAWGDNFYGQLGDSSNTNRDSPVQVSGGGTTWVAIAAGGFYTVALKSNGTLWVWGDNFYGQLGDGTNDDRNAPVQVSGGGTTWVAIATGGYHTVALKSDGTLWTWGRNLYGQLGDDTNTDRNAPVQVSGGGTTWVANAAGYYHAVALKSDGTLWAWGRNDYGALGDGTNTNRTAPVQASGGGDAWVAIKAGSSHTVALKSDGTLWAWGFNGEGELGDGTNTNRTARVQVSGGGNAWTTIEAGLGHTVALKSDGTLWAWGYNSSGQLGDGTANNRFAPVQVSGGGTTWVAIEAGAFHTVALKSDGTLWAWGDNFYGQLGDGTNTHRTAPVQVSGGGSTWVAIAAGGDHTAALKSDGTLWAWGRNNYGQLGDSSNTNRNAPVQVSGGGTTWVAIAAGYYHTVALKSDGTLWTWGRNASSQLGDGTNTDRDVPVQVSGGGNTWVAIAAGHQHTVALKSDGTLWAWGLNNYGQLGDGTNLGRTAPVQVSGGGNTWVAIAAGDFHTLALKSDGTLWAWGENDIAQLGDGTTTNRNSPVRAAAKRQLPDFDGDWKTDISFYRASTGVWWVTPSSGAPAYGYGWGGPGFKPVPGDYDGDGKTDVAIYDTTSGAWWVVPSSGAAAYGVGWGGSGFTPVPGDYDGDGKTDIAIYNTTGGAWWIIPSSAAPAYGVGWGGPAFNPVPGDYDGDGKTDIAIYDTTGGAWWIIPSSGAPAYGVGWGGPAFNPVPVDYDGDGKTDIAIYHTTNGGWWIIPSSGVGPQGQVGAYGVGWGGSGFTPVPGDYDGDGKTDVAIYQTSNGGWWFIRSSDGSTYGMGWGGDASDIPLTTNPD